MIEFVESVSLARVLAEHRTILAFLHQGIPDAAGAEGRGEGTCFEWCTPCNSRLLNTLSKSGSNTDMTGQQCVRCSVFCLSTCYSFPQSRQG